MDNRLDQNRFLKILEKSPEPRFYYASLMFCKLAEHIWLDEIYDFTVLHGFSHIKQVLKNQEDLFAKFTDNEILDRFGEKFLFTLLSATYAHDFGMKEYYTSVYDNLAGKEYYKLSFQEKNKIRNIHHEIIDTVLSNLIDDKTLNNFFGRPILQYLEMVLKGNYDLIDKTKKLILDNSRKIGIIAKYHNQPLDELDGLLNRLKDQHKLHLNQEELKNLKLATAVLQFSDALDMSISRVDIEKFIVLIKNMHELDFAQYQMIHKSSRSYMIDEIISQYIDEKKKNYKIEFLMSLSEKDLDTHYEYAESLKKEYEKRIQRDDRDCLKIIEDNLEFSTNIVCSQNVINKNENKVMLPEVFFKIKKSDKQTMKGFLEEKIRDLSSISVLSFFKFYSNSANDFYGGLCYFPNKSFNELKATDIDIKSYLERIIFYPSDWNIDIKKSYDYSKINEIKNFGLKERHHILDYKEYFRYYKSIGIKSEIHYPLKYRNIVIGFVKLHYKSELSEKEQATEISRLEDKLYTFGIEIQNIFEHNIIHNYIQEISNAIYLSTKNKEDLKSLFKNLFEQYPYPITEGKLTSLADIKKVLDIKSANKDESIFVFINNGILSDLYKEASKYSFFLLGQVVWSVNMDRSERLLSIDCKLSSHAILTSLVKKEFLQASIYFEDDYPDEISSNYRITRYVIPLKCFVYSFGGNIYSELQDNNKSLLIKMIFPKYFKR